MKPEELLKQAESVFGNEQKLTCWKAEKRCREDVTGHVFEAIARHAEIG